MALARLFTLFISSLHNLDILANESTIEPISFIMQHFLLGVILNMLFGLI